MSDFVQNSLLCNGGWKTRTIDQATLEGRPTVSRQARYTQLGDKINDEEIRGGLLAQTQRRCRGLDGARRQNTDRTETCADLGKQRSERRIIWVKRGVVHLSGQAHQQITWLTDAAEAAAL